MKSNAGVRMFVDRNICRLQDGIRIVENEKLASLQNIILTLYSKASGFKLKAISKMDNSTSVVLLSSMVLTSIIVSLRLSRSKFHNPHLGI